MPVYCLPSVPSKNDGAEGGRVSDDGKSKK